MADPYTNDLMDSHSESPGHSNDDFEKLDAPGSGFGFDQGDMDGSNAAGAGAYDDFGFNQDAEISTTTTTDLIGEDEAEEDRYAAGASEAEAYAHSSNPLISLGDEDDTFRVQPSAPVPDIQPPPIVEPLIDFGNTTDQDNLHKATSSAPPPSSNTPEPIPSTSNRQKENKESESRQVEKSSESEETAAKTKAGSWLKGVDPRGPKEGESSTESASPVFLVDLIYWRDVKKTGIVFGTMLVVLLSLAIFSLLSVVSYLSLALLTVTFSFFLYKRIMGAVQKSNEDHPYKQLLDLDINLNEDKLRTVISNVLKNINCLTNEVRRLFLVQDVVDSIKFGILLWVFTYIGSWFNGMTLIIMALVLLFTLPKVYETYQPQIDNYIGLAKAQINNVLNIIQSKVPFLKKKAKAQ